MNTPKEFLNYFLESRGLTSPDGRPLYGYKISDAHYDSLKELLMNYWEDSKENQACFVLFAVEFLRGEFDESHLNWDSIFSTIKMSGLNQHTTRSSIVRQGLQYWNRPLYSSESANEYIETLRFESGLPNSCLHEQNNVARLITKSYQFLETYNISELELINVIHANNLVNYLPGVLRQDTFYELVAKICSRFLFLKDRFYSGKEDNPIELLNTKHPEWKEDMPLRISGQKMELFFDNLVSEISSIEKLDRQIIQIIHELIQTNDQFSIKSQVHVPKGIYSASAFSIDNNSLFEDLPGHFVMLLECEDLIKPLAYLSKTADGRISSNGVLVDLPIKVYGKDWKIGFSSGKHAIELNTGISQSFQLTQHEPLLFILNESDRWAFKGSGNQKVRKPSGRVLIPDSVHFVGREHPNCLAKTETGLSIFDLSESTSFVNTTDQFEYNVSFNQESESIYSVHLMPNDDGENSQKLIRFLNPGTFFDIPRVYLYNSLFGMYERFNGDIQFLETGKQWTSLNKHTRFGLIRLRFLNPAGEVIGYQKITLLPRDFNIKINERTNEIHIVSSEQFNVLAERGDVSCRTSNQESSVTIHLNTDKIDEYPYLNFMIRFNDDQTVKVKLPNPVVHEVFTNNQNEIITRTRIELDNIHGNAININNFSDQKINKNYSLKLVGQQHYQGESLEIRRSIPVAPYNSVRYPLFHWMNELKTLLTLNQSVDAAVRISSGQMHHYVEVNRFEYSPKIRDGKLFIEQPFDPSEIQLKAFRLNQLFIPESVQLLDYDHESNSWHLETSLPNGIWFVFSGEESDLMLRPKVFINQIQKSDYDIELAVKNIHETSIMEYMERQHKLIEFFDGKHAAFDDAVWEELYKLYNETKHLPFDTLDVWKALVHSEKGMLTLLLSNWGDEELVINLAKEFSFNWRLIPLSVWQTTLQAWYLTIWQDKFFEIILAHKTEFIKSQLNLTIIKEIIQEQRLDISEREFKQALERTIQGGLRIRHPEGTDRWPTLASDFIKEKYLLLPDNYWSIIPGQFSNWQKPVIYLPVIMAYQSVNGNMINQSELDPKTKLSLWLTSEFDMEYFRVAFDLCQSFFYSKQQASNS